MMRSPKFKGTAMKLRPRESDVALFVCHRGLYKKGIVLGRWIFPRNFGDLKALRVCIDALVKLGDRVMARGKSEPRPGVDWLVDESNGVEHVLVRRASLETCFVHSKACLKYGLPTVRAYHEAIGEWPSTADLKDRLVMHHSSVLPWINKYLRRRGELRGKRGLIKSPDGRQWLTGEAHRVLSKSFRVHIGFRGEVWLFTQDRTERFVKTMDRRTP